MHRQRAAFVFHDTAATDTVRYLIRHEQRQSVFKADNLCRNIISATSALINAAKIAQSGIRSYRFYRQTNHTCDLSQSFKIKFFL